MVTLGEVGVPGLVNGRPEPMTPELVVDLTWPLAVKTYDRIRKSDSKVAATLRAINAPVIGGDWRIDPRNASDEVVRHVADDLALPVLGEDDRTPDRTGARFDWTYFIRHCMLALTFGFMPFEQVWRMGADGAVHIKKLAPRMPSTLTWNGIRVADDGGLLGIEQMHVCGPVFIPVDRLVMFTHDREGADWYGQSLLRPVYRDWLLKDRYHRIASVLMQRNGAGVPIFVDPPPETVDDPKEAAEAGQKLAERYRVGDNAGGRIPYGAKLMLQGIDGDIPPILEHIRYHDEAIATSMLEMFSSLGSAKNGSRALGVALVDFFIRALNSYAQWVSTIVTNHIIEDLVDANWGPDTPAPAVQCAEIGADQQITADTLSRLAHAGVLTPDDGLEQYVRRFWALPSLPKELEGRERLVSTVALDGGGEDA